MFEQGARVRRLDELLGRGRLAAGGFGRRQQLFADFIERALERRLRERALRADGEVEINPETLERWIREELESIVRDFAVARELDQASRVLN